MREYSKKKNASKFDLNAYPALYFTFSSETFSNFELYEIIKTDMEPEIERIPAVGGTGLEGAKDFVLHMFPINKAMIQHNLTPLDIKK